MTTSEILYFLGYAYGYHETDLPFKPLEQESIFKGWQDGKGDYNSGNLPEADFDCGRHHTRKADTVFITGIENPLDTVALGDWDGRFYILGKYEHRGAIIYQKTSGSWKVINPISYD